MEWEVFRRPGPANEYQYCGNLDAPDRELAVDYATALYTRRKETYELLVIPGTAIARVSEDEACFGGRTDRSYRLVSGYTEDYNTIES